MEYAASNYTESCMATAVYGAVIALMVKMGARYSMQLVVVLGGLAVIQYTYAPEALLVMAVFVTGGACGAVSVFNVVEKVDAIIASAAPDGPPEQAPINPEDTCPRCIAKKKARELAATEPRNLLPPAPTTDPCIGDESIPTGGMTKKKHHVHWMHVGLGPPVHDVHHTPPDDLERVD